MSLIDLKYGLNPQQKNASLNAQEGGEMPLRVLNGLPGYINIMDALNGWQLVRQLDMLTDLPAAASFKHVSPAGAAVYSEITPQELKSFQAEDLELSPMAAAYVRARGADMLSSYGDYAALSRICDAATAKVLKREVSDGVIAPAYTPEALQILRKKRKGSYIVLQIDPSYQPDPEVLDRRTIFGLELLQERDDSLISADLLKDRPTQLKDLSDEATQDLLIAMAILRFTQSNSVCYVSRGQAIGIGAGQQSRIHCTRLAGDKADHWHWRQHPKVLSLPFKDDIRRVDRNNAIDVYLSEHPEDIIGDGIWQDAFTEKPELLSVEEKSAWLAQVSPVALASDAFLPFGDNVKRAARSGVRYIAEPGGSIRDDHVIETADRLGITLCFTGLRLFHH